YSQEVLPANFGEGPRDAVYRFEALSRVGLSLFPPKPFDWEKSWRQQAVLASGTSPGALRYPSEPVLRYWESLGVTDAFVNAMVDADATPLWLKPDKIFQPQEFRECTANAGKHNIRIMTYLNPGRYGESDIDKVIADVAYLKTQYGLRGMYLDGLYRNYDWLYSYEFIRKLRDVLGPEGSIL